MVGRVELREVAEGLGIPATDLARLEITPRQITGWYWQRGDDGEIQRRKRGPYSSFDEPLMYPVRWVLRESLVDSMDYSHSEPRVEPGRTDWTIEGPGAPPSAAPGPDDPSPF